MTLDTSGIYYSNSSNCSTIEDNETISKQQFNLFQKITGINATAAQSVWQDVEAGITNVRHRLSERSNVLPKFHLEITYVSKVVDLPPLTLRFKRQGTGPINPIPWNKEYIKEGIVYNSGVVIIQKAGLYYISLVARNPYDTARLVLRVKRNNSNVIAVDKSVQVIDDK